MCACIMQLLLACAPLHMSAAQCCSGGSLFLCLVCLSLSSCIAQDQQVLRVETHFPVTVGSDLFWSMTAVISGFDHLCFAHQV